jgi:hypothetical protein
METFNLSIKVFTDMITFQNNNNTANDIIFEKPPPKRRGA